MTKKKSVYNQEILEKAIRKATNRGWSGNLDYSKVHDTTWIVYGNSHTLLDGSVPTEVLYHPSHSFAKAFFGDEPYYRFDGDSLDTPRQWQYHLQQMVVSDDPIKYLGDNIGV